MKEFLDQSKKQTEETNQALANRLSGEYVDGGPREDKNDLQKRKDEAFDHLNKMKNEATDSTDFFEEINPGGLPISVLKESFQNEIESIRKEMKNVKNYNHLDEAEKLSLYGKMSEEARIKEEQVSQMDNFILIENTDSVLEDFKKEDEEKAKKIDQGVYDQKIDLN